MFANVITQFLQSETGSADNSFRRTLLEIEDTYYRTFPEAAQADGYQPRWRMTGNSKERTDESTIGFFSHTSGTRVPHPYASSGHSAFSGQPAPYGGGSLARPYGVGDVQMDDSTVRMTTHTLAEPYQHPFSVPATMSSTSASHGTYETSRMPQAVRPVHFPSIALPGVLTRALTSAGTLDC